MNQELRWYQPIADSWEGIVLESGDSATIVMDRLARVVALVSAKVEPLSLEALAQSQLVNLLSDVDQQMAKVPLRFVLHTNLEALYSSPEIRSALPKLFSGLLSVGSAELVIDFVSPPRDWILFALWVYRLLWEQRKLYGHIHLRGSFPLLPDEVKKAFYELRIRLEYAAGWHPRGGSDASEIADPDALRDLARYGFRIPVLYYAHAGNMDDAVEILGRCLQLNEHSGFAVPAIFHHPQYDPESSPPPLSAGAYAELLVRLYHDFPHYDDLFQPVAELVTLISEGGWNALQAVPSILRLVLRPERGISIFRQVPAQAVPWVDYADLRSCPVADIAPRLLEFHRQRFAWSKHAFCGRCQWRYVCGGSDAVSVLRHEAEEISQAACEYRMFFLEEFARKKADFSALRLPRTASEDRPGEVCPAP